MDDLLERAAARFGGLLGAVGADQWPAPTPCADWSVRELANHLAGELLWIPPMLSGVTIEEVGDRFAGDVLGDDPAAMWGHACSDALTVAAATDPDTIVHLSYGDRPAAHYLFEVGVDTLVHGWDLARAIGEDETLPEDLVGVVTDWFDDHEAGWRAAGVIAAAVEVDASESPQVKLLARFGRDAR